MLLALPRVTVRAVERDDARDPAPAADVFVVRRTDCLKLAVDIVEALSVPTLVSAAPIVVNVAPADVVKAILLNPILAWNDVSTSLGSSHFGMRRFAISFVYIFS
jgi:Na+/H+-translocating membrane pyrophosphatase